jgi:hypothetical protein
MLWKPPEIEDRVAAIIGSTFEAGQTTAPYASRMEVPALQL